MRDPLESSDRYQLMRRLAVGGMGEVLLARFVGDSDIEPGLVVLKRTLPDHPNRAHQNTMLREEARVAMRLRHANLVETFRLDEVGGDPLLVMEYLAGRSMAQVLGAAKRNQRPLPFAVAVKILHEVACGLHFAHTLRDRGRPLGLVHRDVSPANLFVTFDGRVKVIDFGVAKADDSEIRTSTGILKGKIGYMSPEHARGDALDPRSDLWSLGVVFWEMLVADRLFSGPNPATTLHLITAGKIPSPRSRRPELPRPLEELCMCLLERDRNHRVQSGAELVALIAQLRALDAGVDLAAFISERFPDEAEAGRREAREVARPRRRSPIPIGLVEGGAPIGEDEPDDVAPTQVMERAQLLAMARAAGDPNRHPTLEEDDVADAPTAILSTASESAAPVLEARAPEPEDRGEGAPTVPARPPRAPATTTASPPEAPRPGPSAVAVALLTFGLIAAVMGAVFAFIAHSRASSPTYWAVSADQVLIVVARRGDLPPGAPLERVGQLDPERPPPLGLSGEEILARLEESGVAARARLPGTPRARLAAALPAGITFLGLVALALSLPGILLRRARGAAMAVRLLLLGAVAGGGGVLAKHGALGWPGLDALDEPVEPPRLELPLATPTPKGAPRGPGAGPATPPR